MNFIVNTFRGFNLEENINMVVLRKVIRIFLFIIKHIL